MKNKARFDTGSQSYLVTHLTNIHEERKNMASINPKKCTDNIYGSQIAT